MVIFVTVFFSHIFNSHFVFFVFWLWKHNKRRYLATFPC
jgi:hypothetical protein